MDHKVINRYFKTHLRLFSSEKKKYNLESDINLQIYKFYIHKVKYSNNNKSKFL